MEFIKSNDPSHSYQIGEKGHFEYGWSNDIQERICQFNYQLTRIHLNDKEFDNDVTSQPSQLNTLSRVLKELLSTLTMKMQTTNDTKERDHTMNYLAILYQMIGYTRDIYSGKGERLLSYMMIYVWNRYFPSLAEFALKCFLVLENDNQLPFGSWKDFKYFCKYCKQYPNANDDTNTRNLIQCGIYYVNRQLKKDHENAKAGYPVSLVAKWVPREKSAFGWLYEQLATDYFGHYLTKTTTTTTQTCENRKQEKAIVKCKTHYRKVLSFLNRYIDTTQIKQCNQQWKDIQFHKVTSTTMIKQRNAFLNVRKNGTPKHENMEDREKCATNLKRFFHEQIQNNKLVNGKCIHLNDFVKEALELLSFERDEHKDLFQIKKAMLNAQWKDKMEQYPSLPAMIPIVDVSHSMKGSSFYAAIALGIYISEKSILGNIGNRILTFCSAPEWNNLEECHGFVDKVKQLSEVEWGTNTNFYAALDLLLNAIVENKMDAVDVEDMTFVILSDMQMDEEDDYNKTTLYDKIKQKYEIAGLNLHGIPYRPPHLLFWNLRSTTGFPSLSTTQNVSFLSGFSPSLLNSFQDNDTNVTFKPRQKEMSFCSVDRKERTPWINLTSDLERNHRLRVFKDEIYRVFQCSI